MDVQRKIDGHSKGNKNSLVIGKLSSNRKVTKSNSKQSYLKGTSASKSHLPCLKTTPMPKVATSKYAQTSKATSSKPIVRLSCSTNRISKDEERYMIKPGNVIRPKTATKSNVNLLKSTTKSVKVYKNSYNSQPFEQKGDLKNNDILSAIKFDNEISKSIIFYSIFLKN